jgi:hypothetical protein
MFINSATLTSAVQDVLQKSETLESFWTSIITAALSESYNDIVSVMTARGYSPGQLLSWDRGIEFQTDLGIFWALAKGRVTQEVTAEKLKELDRRQELRIVVFTIAGLIVAPAFDGQNIVVTGIMSNSTLDIFNANPSDPNYTQW